MSDSNRYPNETIFHSRGMRQLAGESDYRNGDGPLSNQSAPSHLRGENSATLAQNSANNNNGELFASIDKALSISLKRPSSRGSNLDLLAAQLNSKLNSSSIGDVKTSRSRGAGRVNNENKPVNVMSISSSQSRDDAILVNSSVIPVPAGEEGNGREYSEGDGSETSRSQTMSNITTSTRSVHNHHYSQNGDGRRSWSPLRYTSPSSRIGIDFRAPFPTVRNSPSNERRSHYSNQSHQSHSSGRSSVESSSAYPDSHSKHSNRSNKLTIGFKKSNEGDTLLILSSIYIECNIITVMLLHCAGDYVQGLLSQNKNGSFFKDAPPHSDPLASRHSVMRFSMAPNVGRQVAKHTYSGASPLPSYSEYGSPLNISRSRSTGRVVRTVSSSTINPNRNTYQDNSNNNERSSTPTPGYLNSTSSFTKKNTARVSPSRFPSNVNRSSGGNNISFSNQKASRASQPSPSYFSDNAENGAVSYFGLSGQQENRGDEMHPVTYQGGSGGEYHRDHDADHMHSHGHSYHHGDDRYHFHQQQQQQQQQQPQQNHGDRARERFESFYERPREEGYRDAPSPDHTQQPYPYYSDAEQPYPRGRSGYSQQNNSNKNNNNKNYYGNGNQLNTSSGNISFSNQCSLRPTPAMVPRGRMRSSSAQPNSRDNFRFVNQPIQISYIHTNTYIHTEIAWTTGKEGAA